MTLYDVSPTEVSQRPANIVCGFCRKPAVGEFYRVMERDACSTCAAQASGAARRHAFALEPFANATVAGLVTALAGAFVWAEIVRVSHLEIGIVASLIGVAVGKSIVHRTEQRRGRPYQWLAVVLSIVGLVGGRLLIDYMEVVKVLGEKGLHTSADRVMAVLVHVLQAKPSALFSGLDLLWIGIAVYAAWRICKAPNITLTGPFAVPTSPAAETQFPTASL